MNAHRAKFTSPFAPLQLSDIGYEQYALQGGGTHGADKRVWKPVKRHRGVCVFAQRKNQTEEDPMDEIRQSIDSFTGSGAVQPSGLPVMLIVGSTPGTLDDVMCDLMCPTIEGMRVKTSYIDYQVADVAVLQTITVPTLDDLYQSLVIKWTHNRLNLLCRSLISYRDFVYLDRTGITYTSSGERLGFHLLRSVHFPQTHELPPIQHGNISVCSIYRGDSERNQVEIIVRGIVDPSGNAPKSMIIRAGAEMYIAISKYVECSYRKKLMRRLRMKQQNGDQLSKLSSDTLGVCTTCKRLPSRISSVLSNDSRKCRRALCAKYVCSSCRIKKALSQVASASSELWQREFAFCSSCYSEATRLDVFTAALQEFVLSKAASDRASKSLRSSEDLNSVTSSSQGS